MGLMIFVCKALSCNTLKSQLCTFFMVLEQALKQASDPENSIIKINCLIIQFNYFSNVIAWWLQRTDYNTEYLVTDGNSSINKTVRQRTAYKGFIIWKSGKKTVTQMKIVHDSTSQIMVCWITQLYFYS